MALVDNARVSKGRKKRRAGGGDSRAVVSYFDGTWTDRLRARCLAIESEGGALRLVLEMKRRGGKSAARPDALEKFVATRRRIESILLLKPAFRRKLRERLLGTDSRTLSVSLHALEAAIEYPASAVFGPDGITLTLG